MRLQCPNCDAQYEVADDAVPENGRDVQCSNCGYTWFQAHPDALIEEEEQDLAVPPEPEMPDEPDPVPDPEPEPQPEPEAEPEPQPEPDAEPQDLPEDDGDAEPEEPTEDEADEDETPFDDLPERKPLDEGVASILREEAEREQQARAEERGETIETQTEMGLDSTDEAIAGMMATERTARLKGAEPGQEEIDARSRDLLPDIEEINSTLRATSERGDGVPDVVDPDTVAPRRRRSGFRFGFGLMLVIAALAVAVYQYSPALAERFPEYEGQLAAYVDWVNWLRAWLDQTAQSLTERIKALTEAEA